MVRYRVFGTVEASGASGAEVRFARRQDRVLWGLLLLDDRPITVETLCRLLWPVDQPEHPLRALQVGVSRIRRALADAEATDTEIIARDRTYQLCVPAKGADVRLFRQLAESARSEAEPAARAEAARAAVRLWRGEPMEGLVPELVRDEITGALRELRIDLARTLLDAQLACGEVESELADLWRELHRAHPYRDDVASAAASGLAARGRRVEALDLLRAHRSAMVDDLGLDVAQNLVGLERTLLQQPAATPQPDRPQQLPPDPMLIGREHLVGELTYVLQGGRESAVLLHGAAGVGKTALAVGLAHRLASDMPDGVVVVSARAGRGRPLPPIEILHRVLAGCGLTPGDRPVEVDQAAATWRSLARTRRLLVVLDDVSGPAQVRPLLAGGAASRVIVTARQPQPEVDGMRDVHVEPLTQEEARCLLPIVESSGEALEAVLATCGGLPLALRIVGARLAGPGAPDLQEVAAALGDVSQRLDWLVAGDLAVRSSLETAYDDCSLAERHALDRLGLLTADGFAAWALAAALGVQECQAESVAAQLCARGLLTRQETDAGARWAVHDLVLSFAAERWGVLSPQERCADSVRLTSRAAHLAAVAATELGLRPQGEPSTEPEDDRGTAVAADPAAWLATERELLEDLVARPPTPDRPDPSADLVLPLTRYLLMAEPSRDLRPLADAWSEQHRDAVPAVATRLGLNVLLALIGAAWDVGDLEDRARGLVAAATATGDAHLTVDAWSGLGVAFAMSGEVDPACDALYSALRIADEVDPPCPDVCSGVEVLLAQTLADAGRLADAVRHAASVLATPLPATRATAASLDKVVHLALDVGDVRLAEDAARRMAEALDGSPDEVGHSFQLLAFSRIAVWRGEMGRAAALLGEARGPLERVGYRRGLARLHCIRAERAVTMGLSADARSEARQSLVYATDERERRRSAALLTRADDQALIPTQDTPAKPGRAQVRCARMGG